MHLKKDKDYVVKDGSVFIIEGTTGRLLLSSRWADELHQAVELKEGLEAGGVCRPEVQLTPRHYFNKYAKLSGTTGTAKDVEHEVKRMYGLDTIQIKSKQPSIESVEPDLVFPTTSERNVEIIKTILNCYHRGQPVLVGTKSIEESERLSLELKNLGVPNELLNARSLFFEANIVAYAGKPNKITIATNVAGRGTDISLGGSKTFASSPKNLELLRSRTKSLGGLKVIGIERHILRREDDQLGGRTSRQGNPGSATFFLSSQEAFWKSAFGKKLDPAVQHSINFCLRSKLDSLIRIAQKQLQDYYFLSKASELNYTNILNNQHHVLSTLRRKLMEVRSDKHLLFQVRNRLKATRERLDNLHLSGKLDVGAGPTPPTDKQKQNSLIIVMRWRQNLLCSLSLWESSSEAHNLLEKHSILREVDRKWSKHLIDLNNLRKDIRLNSWATNNMEREYELYASKLFRVLIKTLEHYILNITLPAFWQ